MQKSTLAILSILVLVTLGGSMTSIYLDQRDRESITVTEGATLKIASDYMATSVPQAGHSLAQTPILERNRAIMFFPQLVWRVDFFTQGGSGFIYSVLVDAHTGKIVDVIKSVR